MASGDYRLKIRDAAIFPQDRVVAEYEFGVEDGDGNTVVLERRTMTLTWDEFVSITTTSQRSALAAINTALKDEIKSRIALLAEALDL